MSIKKISVENFRIFKEKTEFLLRPFTVLTGPNNSGKSSFTKLLLLLKEGTTILNFEKGIHNLEEYIKVLNWHNNSSELKLGFSNGSYDFELSYNEEAILERLKCCDKNELVFDFYFKKGEDFYDNQNFIGESKSYTHDTLQRFTLNFNYFLSQFSDLPKGQFINFFDVKIDDEVVTDNFIDDIFEFQDTIFNDEVYHFINLDYNEKTEDFYKMLNRVYDLLYHKIKGLKNKLIKVTGNKNIKVVYSELGKQLLLNQDHFDDFSQKYNNYNYFENLFSSLVRSSKLDNQLRELHYISANRSNQKRVLSNKSDNDIDEIIMEFTKRKYINKNFIDNCLKILNIEGELVVERFENLISAVYIKTNERKLSLSDLGFGLSQVIPIILKAHNLSQDKKSVSKTLMNSKTLILEEPEANLHPNLQSKLAEVLVYVRETFNIHFIIETHSEYFIRKLQYLTAKGNLKEKDSVIYYFNDDKYVSKTEPKVKEIFINKDGGLTDSFGPGFFDESTKLQFDLIKLNKQQLN